MLSGTSLFSPHVVFGDWLYVCLLHVCSYVSSSQFILVALQTERHILAHESEKYFI